MPRVDGVKDARSSSTATSASGTRLFCKLRRASAMLIAASIKRQRSQASLCALHFVPGRRRGQTWRDRRDGARTRCRAASTSDANTEHTAEAGGASLARLLLLRRRRPSQGVALFIIACVSGPEGRRLHEIQSLGNSIGGRLYPESEGAVTAKVWSGLAPWLSGQLSGTSDDALPLSLAFTSLPPTDVLIRAGSRLVGTLMGVDPRGGTSAAPERSEGTGQALRVLCEHDRLRARARTGRGAATRADGHRCAEEKDDPRDGAALVDARHRHDERAPEEPAPTCARLSWT